MTMNYREQQRLRDLAHGAGRHDLVQALDSASAELDELGDRTREAYRLYQAASDKQEAKAHEVRALEQQIRELEG